MTYADSGDKSGGDEAERHCGLSVFSEIERLEAFRLLIVEKKPLWAVAYLPDAYGFLSGEDPLRLLQQVPDLCALKIEGPLFVSDGKTDGCGERSMLCFRLLTTATRNA
ncbi:hypothetical protein CCP2SC5_1230007 [Azospirillaceae bacterium]